MFESFKLFFHSTLLEGGHARTGSFSGKKRKGEAAFCIRKGEAFEEKRSERDPRSITIAQKKTLKKCSRNALKKCSQEMLSRNALYQEMLSARSGSTFCPEDR